MLQLAHEKGFLTIGYVYTEEDARTMAAAGADIIAAHAGLTSGGDIGAGCACTLEEAIEKVQRVLTAGLEVNPEVIPLCHGGAIESAKDFEQVFRKTCAVGFIGASSIERIPVERAIRQTVQEFKSVHK